MERMDCVLVCVGNGKKKEELSTHDRCNHTQCKCVCVFRVCVFVCLCVCVFVGVLCCDEQTVDL